MRRWWLSLGIFCLVACGRVPARPAPLSDQIPTLLQVLPSGAQALGLRPKLLLLFSQAMDPTTIDEQSILLLPIVLSQDLVDSSLKLNREVDQENLTSVPLNFAMTPDQTLIVVEPAYDLQAGVEYTFVVTTRVLSQARLSFQQGGLHPFARYYRTLSPSAEPAPIAPQVSSSQPMTEPEPASPNEPTAAWDDFEAEIIDKSQEAIPLPPEPPLVEPMQPVAPLPTEEPSEPLPPETQPFIPPTDPPAEIPVETPIVAPVGKVVINELFYDAVGTDTNGVLFIELYGPAGQDISGYQLLFINGDDGKIYDTLSLPTSAHLGADGFYVIADAKSSAAIESFVVQADLIKNFDPQNGPDALQLFDLQGKIMDVLGYGTGLPPQAENGLATFEGTAAPDVINGHTLGRKVAGQDTDDNQADFIDQAVPTPRL